ALVDDRVADLKEDHGQVAPEQGADEQVELGLPELGRPHPTAHRGQPGRQVADAEHADQRVDEVRHLPGPVPADEVLLALEQAVKGARLLPGERCDQAISSWSASARARPESLKKSSSSDPSRSGVPSARTLPWSIRTT